MEHLLDLLLAIAEVGRLHHHYPPLEAVEPFGEYFSEDGSLRRQDLDKMDGSHVRREILLRYLLLNAVLDQGPDVVGVRDMLVRVVNALYSRGTRIFHRPESFFEEIAVSVDEISENHEKVKSLRKGIWARENRVTNPDRYNLFMDGSTQVLDYAISRWGVPIALPMLLEMDCARNGATPATAVYTYLRKHESAENMSSDLKMSPRYGLGKAIGDKACHLYAKWVCSSFGLVNEPGPEWGPFSYEVPFDSNAGRVLWRTGFFLSLASETDYIKAQVIQRGEGKGGTDYLRITNIRGMGCTTHVDEWVRKNHDYVCTKTLRTHCRKPIKVQIQRVPHALMIDVHERTGLGVADLDEGLMYLGTNYCLNHASPKCPECPVRSLCEGSCGRGNLVEGYRT